MSKHNYSQYSNKKKNHDVNVKIIQATELPELKPEAFVNAHPDPVGEPGPMGVPGYEQPDVKMVVETVETVTLPNTVKGVVVNCTKLNVRAEPSVNAEVVCVLDVMSEIEIDVAASDNEWLKISTVTGVEGYCMRKFVDARL